MKNCLRVLLFPIILLSCHSFGQDMEKAEHKIQNLLTKTLKDKKIHHAFLMVHSDSLNIHWNYFDTERIPDNQTDSPDYHFYHTASIGKSFVGVLISILYEKGLIRFDDLISQYLNDEILSGLHEFEGTDYSHRIQIKHLLNHTSGIPDFFSGIEIEGRSFSEYITAYPDKFWTPTETISLAKKYGEAAFAPGTGCQYSDTEYNLLGLIIERATGMKLHEALEHYIFEPLEMKHTSLWLRSEPRIKSKHKLTEVYFNDVEVSKMQSISCDWAGGGIVSTSEDLLKFIKALNKNTLISPATYNLMQQWQKESKGIYYGYGLMQFRFRELFFALPKEIITGHSGSIGSFMYYNKKNDLYFIGSFGQSEYQKKHISFIIKAMSILLKEIKT